MLSLTVEPEPVTPQRSICTDIYIVTILPRDRRTSLRALGKEQRLEQDIFVGPSGGPAWLGRTQHLYNVATPSLLPELIPVWPLAVKVAVSHGRHAKRIRKAEAHNEPSLVHSFGVSLGIQEVGMSAGMPAQSCPHPPNGQRGLGYPSRFPNHLPQCALVTPVPSCVSSPHLPSCTHRALSRLRMQRGGPPRGTGQSVGEVCPGSHGQSPLSLMGC